MADISLIANRAAAMLAGAASNPPRDQWKDRDGFNIVSLGAWLDVCKAAGFHLSGVPVALKGTAT